jgi:hypothetical protein
MTVSNGYAVPLACGSMFGIFEGALKNKRIRGERGIKEFCKIFLNCCQY